MEQNENLNGIPIDIRDGQRVPPYSDPYPESVSGYEYSLRRMPSQKLKHLKTEYFGNGYEIFFNRVLEDGSLSDDKFSVNSDDFGDVIITEEFKGAIKAPVLNAESVLGIDSQSIDMNEFLVEEKSQPKIDQIEQPTKPIEQKDGILLFFEKLKKKDQKMELEITLRIPDLDFVAKMLENNFDLSDDEIENYKRTIATSIMESTEVEIKNQIVLNIKEKLGLPEDKIEIEQIDED